MNHTKKNYILITVLFSLGWAFMYADRNILSPIMSVIGEDWNLSKSELGLMSTVFFTTYALMQIPAGFLADRFGRVKVLVGGYLLFAVGTFFSGIVSGLGLFLVVRAITGFGEGTYYGPQYAISSATLPKKYRGFSSAIINSGMALGISAGFIASSYLTFTLHKSWQTSFFVFGILTAVVAILIGVFIKDDVKKPIPAKKEPVQKANLKILLSRNHIFTYILIFCSLYGFFGMLTWLPYYLQTVRGVDGSQTGIISSLVPWASIPGALLFGYLSDHIKNKKPLVLFLALLGAICQIVIPYTQNYSLMITGLVIYGMVGKLALDPILVSYVAENTPTVMYSRAYSIFNFAGMVSSIFAPYITGYFADLTGHLEIGFYISGALLFIGGLLFMFTNKEPNAVAALETADTDFGSIAVPNHR
ncbi:MFS transporter [Sporolactobacillus laevolacticus]|uniref:MFS transporter n=1 Tax=Sporolactobacillus laevolacticus DSM 442 TaxID=1395513 RepID=V6IYS3_9BACL|nr:MFS transporter [Sporolactobacillus laevolacticus]EST12648.1 MFS transporter [Sporolactobacillus laevolacticus DSM 442]